MTDTSNPTPDPEPDRTPLEKLEADIEKARADAQRDLGLGEQPYVESGTVGEEYDDQTIAPG